MKPAPKAESSSDSQPRVPPTADSGLAATLADYQSIGKFTIGLAIAVGVIVTFCYCAFEAQFLPAGLSLGDSLLFLFVAMGFGLSYLLWVALGCVVVVGLSAWRLGRLGFGVVDKSALFIGALLVGVPWVVIAFGLSDGWRTAVEIVAPLLSGICYLCALLIGSKQTKEAHLPDGGPPAPQKLRQLKIVYFGIALILPLIFGTQVSLRLMSNAMSTLGIRTERASLIVDDANYRAIQSVADLIDLPVLACRASDGGAHFVHGVRVWWHGIGERSYVELLRGSPDDKTVAGPRVELTRAGTRVVAWQAGQAPIETCQTLGSDLLFDRYLHDLSPAGIQEIAALQVRLTGRLAGAGLKIVGATITGYTDRQPVTAKNDNNQRLSKRRADSVRCALRALLLHVPESAIEVIGMGSRESLTHCDESFAGDRLDDCLSPDRRVEIKLRLSRITEL
jgi:OOP family OmpA-OmpF porin